MKRILALLLGGVLVPWLVSPHVTLANPAPVTLGASLQSPCLRISSVDPSLTSITLDSPEITELDSAVDFQTFNVFVVRGENSTQETGKPVVPHITRFYRIPDVGSVDLVVQQAEFETHSGIRSLPAQDPDRRNGTALVRDEAVFEKDGWYPPQPAVMSAPMIFRDFRVVMVTLYPVQVNPVTGTARIYSQLAVDLVTNDEPGENEITIHRRPSGSWAKIYRSQIANLDDGALDDVTTTPGTYMILCRSNATVQPFADTLATWKRRLGFNVVVNSSTAAWTQTTMKTALQTAYDSPGGLEYACILGNVNSGTMGMPTSAAEYDHYFAKLAGGDDIEDIGIGRLPCSNATELLTVMSKIMGYERTPFMADTMWFRRAFLYAGIGSGISSNEILMHWAAQQFEEWTDVDSCYIATHSGGVSDPLIAQRLNQGVSFFLWRGSVVGEMQNSAATVAANGFKLPIVLTITCGTGDFGSGGCLSEAWILAGTAANPRGGICGIGTATYGTHVQYNNTVAGGLTYNICNIGVEHLGDALAGAKVELMRSFPGDATALNFVRWNNLMGDPGLSMWTGTPKVINVEFPATVSIGIRRLHPHVTYASGVPIEGATVVAWKGNETYVTAKTDADGYADLPATVNSAGTMTLTVSKYNHKPKLADIACVPADMIVSAASSLLDDDNADGTQGNSNGLINPGETVDLAVFLKNYGTTVTASTVNATLSTTNPNVAVVNGQRAYPTIAPGDSALGVSPFRLQISPLMQQGETANLTVTVIADAQTYYSTIPIVCHASRGSFVSLLVSGGDGDGTLEAGESVQLRVTVLNSGEQAIESAQAALISHSGFVHIIDGQCAYPSIPAGQQSSNAGDLFSVSANIASFPGHQAPMLLVMTSLSGHVDSVSFVLPIGIRSATDPTGPDGYGYYAYEEEDVNYEMHRPFSYVDISSGLGTNLNIGDPGEQPPTSPTYSVVRTLPFPFTFYGQSYSQITICSNGWTGFGDQGDLDMFRNYPIPGMGAADAMICPLWDDLQTTGTGHGVYDYYDAVNHRYIVQWKAQIPQSGPQENFEVILLDPSANPTHDGNGIVICQYQTVQESAGLYNDIPYATLGIVAPRSLTGLQYRFNNAASPGASPLHNGHCIVYTTEAHNQLGDITGTVRDAFTLLPMQNVEVTVDGQGYFVTTNTSGHYTLNDVLVGTYTVRAHKFGYNDATEAGVIVEMDSTESVDFGMLHPEIELSTQQIHVSIPPDPPQVSFDIINDGNGPLNYHMTVDFVPPTSLDDAWDHLSDIDVTGLTGDIQVQGCEFANDSWWVSSGDQNRLQRFDLMGQYVGSIPQPGTSAYGWFDMAWDGSLLYGSDSPDIIGIDFQGNVVDTIPGPLNPNRAIAFDPQSQHFWVADYSSDIFEIDRDGVIQNRFTNSVGITGLAWHRTEPDGYKLFIFGRGSAGQQPVVWRMHPVSGNMQQVGALTSGSGDVSGGCTITSEWNSTLLVFGGIVQNPAGDHLGIYEVTFNTTWITITPMDATVNAGTTYPVSIVFNPSGLRDFTYTVNVTISNNSALPTVVLPVSLTTAQAVPEPGDGLPTEYALHQNYPNPFNTSTTLAFDLKQPGLTSLYVYNLLGQQVATVIDGWHEAGRYRVNLDMQNLASGIYVYRLESGTFSSTRKLILMK